MLLLLLLLLPQRRATTPLHAPHQRPRNPGAPAGRCSAFCAACGGRRLMVVDVCL
jgi:hypothetical protein